MQMKSILILLISLTMSGCCFGQKGITYVLKGYKSIIDSTYETILGDKFIDWGDGSQPGFYYIVEYDYGEPPPEYFELARFLLNIDTSNIIRGWEVYIQDKTTATGDGYYTTFEIVCCNNKPKFFNPQYIYYVKISMEDVFDFHIEPKGYKKEEKGTFFYTPPSTIKK